MSNKIKNNGITLIPFWKKILYSLISLLCLFIMMFVVFLSWRDFMSLVNLKEKVYFSWRVFFISFGFPISFHLLFSIMYACFSDSPRPYRGRVVNFLAWIFFVALLLSVPVSLYVDNKLKYSGYITCSKKSLIAPNEYVKNSKLCN